VDQVATDGRVLQACDGRPQRRVGHSSPKLFLRLYDDGLRRTASVRSRRPSRPFRIVDSQGYAFDEEFLRDLVGRSWHRADDQHGYLRRLAAIFGQRNRPPTAHRLTIPTTVLHGLNDPLVNVSDGPARPRDSRGPVRRLFGNGT
jgi:hypothetical protein